MKVMDLASEIDRNVTAALAEDVGAGDWTAMLTPEGQQARATIVCRGTAVLCGRAWVDACFRKLDASARIDWAANDGDRLDKGSAVCEIAGRTRALLTGERT